MQELESLTPVAPTGASLAESLYQAYPRKAGKGAALTAITKALKKKPYPELLEAVQAFATATAGADL